MKKTVTGRTLRKLLKITISTTRRWEGAGVLSRAGEGDHYLTADVNALLENGAHNFTQPPTWGDLRGGHVVLVRGKEAESQFAITKERLDGLRRSKHLAYIKLPGGRQTEVRYCLASLTEVLGDSQKLVTLSQLVRILARPIANVRRLIDTGELERTFNPLNPAQLHVTYASLVTFLYKYQQLPSWVTPEEWIADCLSSDQPLIGLPQLTTMLETKLRFMPRLLRKYKVWFIRVPRRVAGPGRIKISPVWVESHPEIMTPYAPEDVAKLFDVSVSVVHAWAEAGLIACPLSGHDHSATPFLWEVCWIAYTDRNSGPHRHSIGRTYIQTRRRFNTRLLNTREFAGGIVLSETKVIELAEKGDLRGVKAPDGTWRFSSNQVVLLRRQLQQES